MLCKYRSYISCFHLMLSSYVSICLPIFNIEKENNDKEMRFKKYPPKWRLEDVSVTLVWRFLESLWTLLQIAENITTCRVLSVLLNRNV